MLDRRRFLAATAGFAVAGIALPARAQSLFADTTLAAMRGSIDAAEFGLRPGALDDQSKAFQKMLEKAADADAPVFMPPGRYTVSNIALPRRVRLTGVPGATQIAYGGDGHFLLAENADHIELTGLVLDGSNRWLSEQVNGALDIRQTARFVLDNSRVVGASKYGIALERAGGRIDRSEISGAAEAGIWSVGATGLSITGNTVSDCGNGGILVHRWQAGEDGTIVTGNRVERIHALAGGTGQFGNGINVFRAGNVIVSGNQVSDCAFSAIRSNSGGNIQISGNTCLRSGETAIYSEFAFEGTAVSGNIVDGAANGISVVNFNEGGRLAVISGNIVRNMRTEGPYPADAPGFGVGITAEADTVVSANVIERAPRYGMHLGWGPYLRNVVATGNVVRQAGEGIAVSVVEGVGSTVISDNVFHEVPGGAVVGHRWSEAVTGDLALGGSDWPALTVERNRVG